MNSEQQIFWERVRNMINTILACLSITTNLLSCLIISLTIRIAYRLTSELDADRNIKKGLCLNALQATIHMALVFGTAFATLTEFIFFEKSKS